MNINGTGTGGGSLFDLQASITVDTSKFEQDIKGAVNTAKSLSDALDTKYNVDVTANVRGGDDINELAANIGDIDDKDVDVTADVDGGEDINELADDIDIVDDKSIEVSAETSGYDEVEELAESMDSIDDKDVIVSASVNGSGEVSDLAEGITQIGDNTSDVAGSGAFAALASEIAVRFGAEGALGVVQSLANSIMSIVPDVASAGDAIDKNSQRMFGERTSAAREAYQELAYVFSQNGTSIEQSGAIFRTLTNNIADAKDGFVNAANEIGLSMSVFDGKPVYESFDLIVEALQGYEGEGDKAALAMDLLGNKATALMPLLDSSAESTQALRDASHELGLVMSDEQIDNAVNYTDALDNYNRAIEGLKVDTISALLPVMSDFFNVTSQLVGLFTGDAASLSGNIDMVTASLKGMVDVISDKEANADAIIQAMKDLGDPDNFSAADLEVYQALYEKLLEICPQIAEQYGTTALATSDFTEKLRENTTALMENARQQALSEAMAEHYKAVVAAQDEVVSLQAEVLVNQNRVDAATADAAAATSEILGNLSEKQREIVQNYIDENGVLHDIASVNTELMNNGAAGIMPTEDQIDAITTYTEALGEMSVAETELAGKQDELDGVVANYDEWSRAMAELAGVELPDLEMPDLKLGDTGEQVKNLQTELNKLVDIDIPEDGIFGSKTKTAVETFQTLNGIQPSGMMDAATWEALNAATGANVDVVSKEAEALQKSADASRTLTNDITGADIATGSFAGSVDGAVDSLGGVSDKAGGASDAISGVGDAAAAAGDSIEGLTATAVSEFPKILKKAKDTVSDFKKIMKQLEGKVTVAIDQQKGSIDVRGTYRKGLDYVPYDNYLVYLHEGERVLTKAENETYSRYGDSVQGIDINALADAMARRPIAFSVGARELATVAANESTRANAERTARVNIGYGRGVK